MYILLFIIFLLLIFSGAVSASEVVFFSIIKEKEKHKKVLSKTTLKLIKNPNKLLASILLWNNLFNILTILLFSIFLKYHQFDSFSPFWFFFVEVFLILIAILIFGELLPKIIANKNPVKASHYLSEFLLFLYKVGKIPTNILLKVTSIFQSKKVKNHEKFSLQDVSVELMNNTNNDQILSNLNELSDILAKNVMIPRNKIKYAEYNTTFTNLFEIVLSYGYSRIPICNGGLDKILGIIHIKDFINFSAKNDWHTLIRKPKFCSENTKLDVLLIDFKTNKNHMAIVKNEYGMTSGIITLEDVIEEIVGEITDEFDENKEGYKKISKNVYIFDATFPLNDFFKKFNIDEKKYHNILENSETLAGIFIEETGQIPPKGYIINIGNIRYQVEKSNHRKIENVRVVFN